MKLRGNPLTFAAIHRLRSTVPAGLAWRFALCGFLAACKPAPDPSPPPVQNQPASTNAPVSVVPIPEEFLSPSPTPRPKPSVLPRVVFATSDFQVTTHHGIQGIRAGEALNFLREEDGDYVVQYGALEFKKNKSYFAATYVEPPRPEPTPFAGESAPVAERAAPEPSLPDEPPLSGTIPADDQAVMAEAKKVGSLTESIRALNEQIRSAQDDLDKNSNGATKITPSEIKKASRAIQRLKEKRDDLSKQLTDIGKP